MMKKIIPFAPYILPGTILLVAILMFFDQAATFHYTYIADTTSYPGSGWDFLFGYSADGNQVVQANLVGIFMWILMGIAGVIVFLKNSVEHRFFWAGLLLLGASIFMIIHPFLSILSVHFQEVIEVTESYNIPVSVTYTLGFPLILSGILLLADGVFAFLVSKADESSKNRFYQSSSKSQKRPNPKNRPGR